MSSLARQFLESGSDADLISELKSSLAAPTTLDRAIAGTVSSTTTTTTTALSLSIDDDATMPTTDEEFILSIVDDKLHGPYEEEKIIKVNYFSFCLFLFV